MGPLRGRVLAGASRPASCMSFPRRGGEGLRGGVEGKGGKEGTSPAQSRGPTLQGAGIPPDEAGSEKPTTSLSQN